MIPYASFLYFGLLVYPIVPTILLGLFGRVSWRWVLFITVVMLVVQYSATIGILPQVTVNELWLVAGYALFEWLVALGLLRIRPQVTSRAPYYLALGAALLPLVVIKLLGVLAPSSLIGFLGISYITFRALDVVFGIQDKLITNLPTGQYFAYVFFFPTISSGPIDRYRRFARDWQSQRSRGEFLQDLNTAIHHIFVGFLYKFILGALVKQYWLDPVAAGADLGSNVSYMYAYSAYLFFDFAGYSAFAIGLSYIFGIHTPENFNRPFIATSIADFWNRWHITLSTWFRDHIYMRFVMLATKRRWFRDKYLASYLGFFITFGLMGLWHGPAVNYIVYGLYHGALLSGHNLFERWNQQHRVWGEGPWWRLAGILVTANLVCFGFLIFSGHLIPGQANVAAAAPAYDGVIESASCSSLRGWVWMPGQPATQLLLNLYEGDVVVEANITADQPRPDLPLSNPNHGFDYTLRSTLRDGKPHTYDLRVAGTNYHLRNSPQVLSCTR